MSFVFFLYITNEVDVYISFCYSRAVDVITRKLTSMNPEIIAYVTQILSQEAQRISI